MRKGILLFGILLLIITFCKAEKHQDFILTMNKDTLYGKIKTNLRANYIVFEYQNDKLYFRAPSLQFFGIYKNGKYAYYKTIKDNKGRAIFVRVLKEGKLKLYSCPDKENTLSSTYENQQYYIGNSDEKLMAMTPSSFAHQLTYFVKDQPLLVANLSESNFKDVPKIVEAYNKGMR